MLIPSFRLHAIGGGSSLSRRVNANSQRETLLFVEFNKLIKKGEC